MRALIKSDPWCQHYLGKAVAYRVAASFFTSDQAGYVVFRKFMRDNAKSAIRWARISKGVV